MNHTELIGRLTKDPEIKTTPNGIAVAQFTLAVNRKFKDANGNKQADFINCVAWRQTATLIGQYVHKGNRIAVVGEIQTRSYEGSDKKQHYVTEVVVNEVEFLESASQQTAPQTPPTAPATVIPADAYISATKPNEEVDLPFEV